MYEMYLLYNIALQADMARWSTTSCSDIGIFLLKQREQVITQGLESVSVATALTWSIQVCPTCNISTNLNPPFSICVCVQRELYGNVYI